jgi:hypothetical protein
MGKSKAKAISIAINDGDHSRIDTSNLLNALGIKQYQALIGGLQ